MYCDDLPYDLKRMTAHTVIRLQNLNSISNLRNAYPDLALQSAMYKVYEFSPSQVATARA